VSSKCFQLYYTCSRQTLRRRASPLPFPSFSPLTVTFPKLAVILRPLYVPLQDVSSKNSNIFKDHMQSICYMSSKEKWKDGYYRLFVKDA
jgi:hypothetical protein